MLRTQCQRTSRSVPCFVTRVAFQCQRQTAFKPSAHNRAISTSREQTQSGIGSSDLDSFRRNAFIPETPWVMRRSHVFESVKQWFTSYGEPSATLSDYLTQFSSTVFPYELVRNPASGHDVVIARFLEWLRNQNEDAALHLTNTIAGDGQNNSEGDTVFYQFFAPLDLLAKAAEYNKLQFPDNRIKQLYIAQSQLNELPGALQNDLPVPDIVKYAGKGDVYDSSIWLGLEPTYTPLHRDPNPNLFVQLLSGKTVRLLPPALGQQLYARLQSQLGTRGNSRFRGSEMMQGPERAALFDAVWGAGASEACLEVKLEQSDALFIPKGWWHSIRSNFDDGRMNASVNWWFR